jgi:hypothetical protein
MRARLCSHIKSDGTLCRAIALAGYPQCFAHGGQLRRQQARTTPAVRLGPLADRPSIQRAINRVLQATVSGSLMPERSVALLNRIQFAIGSAARSKPCAPGNSLQPLQSSSPHLLSHPLDSTINQTPDSQLTTHNLQPATEFEHI